MVRLAIDAEISKSGKFVVETFAVTAGPVISMGGLTILPSTTIRDGSLQQAAMLIIPGGEALQEKKHREVMPVIEEAFKKNIPVAAICAGTTLLADMGMLDDALHTSNALFYLKKVSGWYKGEEYYREEKAVADKNIITAGGVYPIEFAREIFKLLRVYDDETVEKWYQLFKNGVWVG